MRLRGLVPREVAHAARVAAAASLLVGVVYAACVTVLDQVVTARLTEAVDVRLAERLSDVREIGLQAPDEDDIDSTPVYLWQVGRAGPVSQASLGAPPLPSSVRPGRNGEKTVRLSGGPFRLVAGSENGVMLIAGQSLQSVDHLGRIQPSGHTLLDQHLVVSDVQSPRPVGVEQARVE